jgi:hypothetical protein
MTPSVLSRAVQRIFGPKRSDFYGMAERARRVPVAELAVAEAALAAGGPIAKRLLRQLREAPEVYRLRPADGSYELRVATRLAPIRGVPRAGWTSDWMPLTTTTARRMELRLSVANAGIVAILGRTADGAAWPKDWHARGEDLAAIRAQGPWLDPSSPAGIRRARVEAAERILLWLGEPNLVIGRGRVQTDPPATVDEIAAFEVREGFSTPEVYRALLSVANGFEIGRLAVLGTRDAYKLDMPGPARLVIAPPSEDGAHALATTGEVVWVEYGEKTSDGRIVAPDLRSWVRGRLVRRAASDIPDAMRTAD